MESINKEENIQTVTNLPEVKENTDINLTRPEKKEESSSTILTTETILIPRKTESKRQVCKDGKERKPFVFTEKRKEAFEKCRQSRLDYIEKKKGALRELGDEKQLSKRENQLERLKNKYIEKMRRAGIEIEIHEPQVSRKRGRDVQVVENQNQNQNGSGAGNHAPFEGEVGYNGGSHVDPSVVPAVPLPSNVHDDKIDQVMTSDTKQSSEQVVHEEEKQEDDANEMDDEEEDVDEEDLEMSDDVYNSSSVENIQSQIEEIRASRPPEILPTVFEERRSHGKLQRPSNSEFFLGHIHDYRTHPSQLFSNTGTKQASGGSKIVWLE